MPEASSLSPELSRTVSALARSLVAAARSWSLYPPDHPAVRTSVERLRASIGEASGNHRLTLGVTPETLLVDGAPASNGDGPVADAAAWLNQRDVLRLTFLGRYAAGAPVVPRPARRGREVRARRGGPARRGRRWAHPAIGARGRSTSTWSSRTAKSSTRPAARTTSGRTSSRRSPSGARPRRSDPAAPASEIAGDSIAIGDLAQDVMAPNCAVDGSPMLTSRPRPSSRPIVTSSGSSGDGARSAHRRDAEPRHRDGIARPRA